ncbi:transcription initiation factor TFIID subunit 13 [Trichomonascus vanleenenianus]|uniref:Taf13p n=1 Tax=Trichomonascus vanleenenianus TaxID=2268995 RepID=UPI003EC9F383
MSLESNRRKRRTNLFTNDLKSLMYAFGDVPNPFPESIVCLEDILQEYIINTCHEAYRVAKTSNRQKIKVDDFKFALRRDSRKLGRVEELLMMQREINEARKTFDNSEGKSLSKSYVDDKKSEKADKPEKPERKKRKEKKKKNDPSPE